MEEREQTRSHKRSDRQSQEKKHIKIETSLGLSSQWPCVVAPNPSAVAALMYYNQVKAGRSNQQSEGFRFS